MKKIKLLIISMVILTLVAAITGCGSSNNNQSSAPAAVTDKNTVVIKNYSFQPAEITINKGETVTWINQDSVGHSVTGTTFKSDILQNGQSFKQTFNETGTFDYNCSPHPYMTGKVIVK